MPDPLDPQTRPPQDRFCDLVLKGGVVDGVIYPGVLIELARGFRFQSLAGTSVGAIAAALAAASEFSRRFGSDIGFNEVLRKVPDDLALEDANGRTMLRALFQTTAPLQRMFDTLVDAFSASKGKFIQTLLCSLWQNYNSVLLGYFIVGFLSVPLAALGGALVACFKLFIYAEYESALPGFHLLSSSEVLGSYPVAIALGILMAVAGFCRTLYQEYQLLTGQPGFGFCSGLSTDGETDGLIDWLHRGLQGAAGLELDRPLTFQDLWSAPCGPKNGDGSCMPKSIDLRMMTTCVSHGRPYELPIVDNAVRIFFRLSEWKHYFPQSVMDHLSHHSERYTHERVDFLSGAVVDGTLLPSIQNSPHPKDIPGSDQNDFRELPVGELPVLVAVRLSMNFPILFQAVPLWAIDHEGGRTIKRGGVAAPEFRKVWFADGGVTSNFPLHIFDNPVPAWPTFGVYIDDASRKRGADGQLALYKNREPFKFELTKFHTSGRGERWRDIRDENEGTDAKPVRTAGFTDYLFAVTLSVKDWPDKANLRMPGIRDRVVTVYKNGLSQGGLKLNLPGWQILRLAYDHGSKAGSELARKFLDTEPRFNPKLEGSPAWLDHRWVRFNAYLSALKTHLQGLSLAAHQAHGTSSLQKQIDQAQKLPPLYCETAFEPILNATQGAALSKALAALESLEAALDADDVVQPYNAQPQNELKARSRT